MRILFDSIIFLVLNLFVGKIVIFYWLEVIGGNRDYRVL